MRAGAAAAGLQQRGAEQVAWRHTPVPAETQALAVEALLLCVPLLLPDCDYAAENDRAARDRQLALSTAGARPAAGDGDDGLPGLIHVADGELLRLSSWRTRWIDLHNQRIYAKATRQRRKLRRRTGSMVHARASAATGWTMLSHMARRAELKERSVQVSAWEQASAVVALYQPRSCGFTATTRPRTPSRSPGSAAPSGTPRSRR